MSFANTQYVEFNGKFSARSKISSGVPQGSILEPLFFLLSINDINDVSTVLNLKCLILFAEDTSVFMSHKNLDYHHMINSEMSKLSIWFRENKLSPNLTTKQNLFCLDQAKDVQIVI